MPNALKTVTVYDEFYNKMDEVKDICNFLPDVSTTDGYDKSKRVSLDVGKVLTALEKSRVEEKKESMDYGRLVDSEARKIAGELKGYQEPHKEAYKELDNQNKEREEKRKNELEQRVEEIRGLPEAMADSDSEGVKMALESLEMEECLDFYEFTSQVLKARNDSKAALSAMFADKLQKEKDAKELDDLRCKQVRQDQKDHDERIAREAREKAEEIAEDKRWQAEQKAKAEAEKVEREKQEALEREKELKEQAEQAERDKIAAEERARIEAENAEKRRLESVEQAKQDEIDRQKAQKEREQEALEKREANKKLVGSIMKKAKEALMTIAEIDESTAKRIITAIKNKEIPAVSIGF